MDVGNYSQALTLAVALLGAALGVLNTWRAWSSDRVRLRVRVSHALGPAGEYALCIETLNLSSFPVTVTAIGFGLVGGRQHVPLTTAVGTHGERLPVRLEARAALTVIQPLVAHPELLSHAYIRTACGLQRESPRGIFRQLHRATGAGPPEPPGSDGSG